MPYGFRITYLNDSEYVRTITLCTHTQGVTGGTDQNSGGCSLC